MELKLNSPTEVYQRINKELTKIISQLKTSSDNSTLCQAQKEAHKLLSQHQKYLRQQLTDLEKNSEWKAFTIAFYGETGAGKSTLIETLRILLQESSKRTSQDQFSKLKSQYIQGEEQLQQLRTSIEQSDAKRDELASQLSSTVQSYEQPHRDALEIMASLEQAIIDFNNSQQQLDTASRQHEQLQNDTAGAVERLQIVIDEHKQTTSFWQRLLRKIPEEVEQNKLSGKLSEATTAYNEVFATLINKQHKAEQDQFTLKQKLSELTKTQNDPCMLLIAQQAKNQCDRQTLAQQYQQAEKQGWQLLEDLKKQADGEIIGDGRADFTRKTQCYHFNYDGQPFTLLDVPGIEGKEGLVLSEIERAVQTAHAVFYVTNQAAPPQTGEGDEQRKGTLEKIKEHLGAQTEVWTIFNKKITNSKALTNRPLTSDDEDISLAELNKRMREHLGTHYREVFSLTALPAFLASTDHFVPDSQNAKRREKMLMDFNAKELLEKSRLNSFIQLLTKQLLANSKNKIARANFNKANDVLTQTIRIIDDEQRNLAELAEKLDQDGYSSVRQLSSSFQSLENRLQSSGTSLIDNFRSNVRKEVYARIDTDIDNEVFERLLKNAVESEHDKLSKKFIESLNTEVKRFQMDAEDIIKHFENQAKELTIIYSKLGNTKLNNKFDFKIKIDNGIKITGLLSGLIGIALAPFTGGASAWVMGAAIITALISVAKALWGFFSTDYKKDQQRESTNENLRNITNKLCESLYDALKDAISKMQPIVTQMEDAIKSSAEQADMQAQLLSKSSQELRALSYQIDNAGKR